MATVFADSRSILHAGDGLQHVAAPPDVCKTPSPGGPVPVPYVNIAASSNLAKGTKKTKIEGKSVATSAANLSTSVGDEPGTAGGGLVSSKTKGKTTWATCSPTVKYEGKGVVRFLDVTQQNGNTFNTAFANLGMPYTMMAYGDDFEDDCDVCGNGPDEHRIHESYDTAGDAAEVVARLRARPLRARRDGESNGNYKKYVNGLTRGQGFMVGVMHCRCGRRFVSRSGNDRTYTNENSFGEFEMFAEFIEPTFAQADYIRGPVTAEGLAAVNACPNPQIPVAAAIDQEWRVSEILARQEETDGYLFPGTCAAQRLLQQAGHAPVAMTEMFYTPTEWDQGPRPAEPMTIPYLRTDLTDEELTRFLGEPEGSPFRNVVLQNRLAPPRVDVDFQPQETVGSCHTCQDILYMTNCPERTCA